MKRCKKEKSNDGEYLFYLSEKITFVNRMGELSEPLNAFSNDLIEFQSHSGVFGSPAVYRDFPIRDVGETKI